MLEKLKWVAYCKRPMGGAEQVVRYLGAYTHRVGISNYRLVSMDQRGVTFRTKDGNTATVSGVEFLGRFLQHVLPPGFVKIRHYGLMASSHATSRLEQARSLLGAKRPELAPVVTDSSTAGDSDDWEVLLLKLTGQDMRICPVCRQRTMVRHPLPPPCSRGPPVQQAA